MNNRKQQILESKKTRIEINSFQAEGGVSEHHLMIHVTEAKLSFAEQLKALFEAYDSVLTNQLQGAHSVFKRYFLSDAANQANTLLGMSTEGAECAVSVVQQAPLNGTKVALWCYLMACMRCVMEPIATFGRWATSIRLPTQSIRHACC